MTLDLRDLLEGWAGVATSTVAFLVSPGVVGPLWPRDLRPGRKVPQVLWPTKCDSESFRNGLLKVVSAQNPLDVLQDALKAKKVLVVYCRRSMSSSSFGL